MHLNFYLKYSFSIKWCSFYVFHLEHKYNYGMLNWSCIQFHVYLNYGEKHQYYLYVSNLFLHVQEKEQFTYVIPSMNHIQHNYAYNESKICTQYSPYKHIIKCTYCPLECRIYSVNFYLQEPLSLCLAYNHWSSSKLQLKKLTLVVFLI